MDIIFVSNLNHESDESGIPLGVLSLATILKMSNYEVNVIDYNKDEYEYIYAACKTDTDYVEAVAEHLIAQNAKVISFYTMCDSYHVVLYVSMLIKRKNPKIKILLGGPQATLTAEETLTKFDFIDVIGLGEGETYISELIGKLLYDIDLDAQEGIAYKTTSGDVSIQSCMVCCNLNDIPQLDYGLIDLNEYETVSLDAGRGCPYACKFCSSKTFFRQKYRMKSMDRLISEIQILKTEHNIEKFRFIHDLFTADSKFLNEFCAKLIKEKLDIVWYCSARLDTLDHDLIETMHKAGCRKVFLGIESGSSKMQKIINKNLDLSKLESIVKTLMLYKIEPTIAFIYGFPGEEIEDIKLTLKVMLELYRINVSMIQLNMWTPLPKTEFTEDCIDSLKFTASGTGLSGDGAALTSDLWIKNTIRSNKNIFPQYFHVPSDVYDTTLHLDKFVISFFRFFRESMEKTMNKILAYYDEDILAWFIDFKSVNPDFHEICNYYHNPDYSTALKKIQMVSKFLKTVEDLKVQKDIYDSFNVESRLYKIVFLKSFMIERGYQNGI